MPDIAFICPTYQEAELHPYTRRAVLSFAKYTPGGRVFVVDDASPGAGDQLRALEGLGAVVRRFDEWGGLTRSWNEGLRLARDAGCEFALVSNNDVAFCEGWYDGLVGLLGAGVHLVAPVSNAPGITSGGLAEVWRYDPLYRLSDEPDELNACSARLRGAYAGRYAEAPVNGFAMLAATGRWWDGRFDRDHVFRPRNDVNSRGRRNPTPLMTCNEDELQGRWRARGWRSAIAPSSFVFHYRSVARGPRYARNRWLRVPRPDRAA